MKHAWNCGSHQLGAAFCNCGHELGQDIPEVTHEMRMAVTEELSEHLVNSTVGAALDPSSMSLKEAWMMGRRQTIAQVIDYPKVKL